MKKILAALLAVLMLVSLAACSSNGTANDVKPSESASGTEGTTGTGSTSDETAAGTEEVDYYQDLSGKKFTTICNTGGNELPEGQTLNDNFLIRHWELTHGITFEYEWAASGDAFTQKQNAIIASGDIPDMMEVDLTQYMLLVKSGLIADLTDVLDKYLCPELVDCYAAGGNKDLEALKVDGRIYGIPRVNGVGDGSPLLWVRKDWLDKLNLEEPTCIADIEVIAKAFMEQDPDGNGKNDTLGLPILAEYAATYGGIGNLGDFFLNVGGAAPYQWRIQDDGTVIYGSLMDGAKETLEMLNGWYQEGIIPADFATWTEDDYNQALAGGQAGIGVAPWWVPWGFVGDSARTDDNAEWLAFALPKEPGGQLYSQARNPAGLSIVVVSKDYKTPEDFVILANRFYTDQSMMDGVESRKILISEGYCTEENADSLGASLNSYSPYHGSTPINMFGIVAESMNKYLNGDFASMDEFKQYMSDRGITKGEISIYTSAAEVCENYLKSEDGRHSGIDNYITYLARYVSLSALFYNTNVEFVMTDFSGTVPAMTSYSNFLESFETEAYTNMIMGKTDGKSISEYFDNFVKSYLAQGGAEITAEVQAEIDAR